MIESAFETDRKFSFDIILKEAGEITDEEKEELMQLSIEMFPEYADLYRKNKYYSAFEPQKSWLVRHEGKIVGTGKFLWKDLSFDDVTLRMCGFGGLVLDMYQQKGIGTSILEAAIQETQRASGDFLYASTENGVADEMLLAQGFELLNVPVVYNQPGENEVLPLNKRIYVYEITPGTLDKLKAQETLNIGDGPV